MIELPIKEQKTKTLVIKENGRSSFFVTPNYVLNCNGGCSASYCYTRRFNRPNIYVNTNWKEINQKVLEHSLTLPVYTPHQTDLKYWTYDIGCDTDVNYHWKLTDWVSILNFYNETPNIKATFATKFTNKNLEDIKVNDGKIRIRFSLMPQILSDKLEPNTSKVKHKLDQIVKLEKCGYDTQFNFSPVIYCDKWLIYYRELFKEIKERNLEKNCEVIFLTHNQSKHDSNLINNFEHEDLLWNPLIQEDKHSQYGGVNKRYQWQLKNQMISDFKKLYSEYFDINTIRYIF